MGDTLLSSRDSYSRLTARMNLAVDRYMRENRRAPVARYSWDESKHPREDDGKFSTSGAMGGHPAHARLKEAIQAREGVLDATLDHIEAVREHAIQKAAPIIAAKLAEAARQELRENAPDDLEAGFRDTIELDPEIVGRSLNVDFTPEDFFTEGSDGEANGIDEEAMDAAIQKAVEKAIKREEKRKGLTAIQKAVVRDHVREIQAEHYAKKPAKGQKELHWITLNGGDGEGTHVQVDGEGKIKAGPKGLADKGVTKLSDFGGKEGKESESSGLTEAAAVSRKWKKNDDGTYTAPNGTTWKKAAAGGEESPVNGKQYAGGHLMPIHGLSEKPPKNPESKGVGSTPPKVKEDRPQKPRPAMSEKDIADEKERKESQKKWDEMSRGPLGRVKWLGETPNHRAQSDSRINLKEWTEFADEIGPEAMGGLVKNLTALAHERIDQATADARKKSTPGFPIPDDSEQWQKDQIRERATQDGNQHGMKKHVKGNPESLLGRQLLQELLDNDNNPSGKTSIENMHDLNRMLAEAKGEKAAPAPSGSWERKGEEKSKPSSNPTHAAVAKRFGIPPEAVASILSTPIEELKRRDEYNPPNHAGDGPITDFERHPLGTARIASWQTDPHNAYVDFLHEFSPHDLVTSEHEDGVKGRDQSYPKYVEWAKSGHEPPPISTAENTKEGGKVVSANRRRVLAAQDAGSKSIKAWHSVQNKETGNPLKYGDVIQAAKEMESAPKAETEKPVPKAPTAKPGVAGSQSSLFGGDDLRTGQKGLFNIIRPEKGSGKKSPPPDLLASVTAEVREILAKKSTLSPADIAGTSKQAESIEGQKDLFSRVNAAVDRYCRLNRNKI